MNITAQRVMRFVVAAALPVPLFVGSFNFQYFYKSFHGYDYETKTCCWTGHDLEVARQHLKTDAVIFIAAGYFLMGIPSLLYSFLLERHRCSPQFRLKSYVSWGAAMGGISGLLAGCLGWGWMIARVSDLLLVVTLSAGIGGFIPLVLYAVLPDKRNMQAHGDAAFEPGRSQKRTP